MRKKASKLPSRKGVMVVMLVAALGVGVFATYVKSTPAAQVIPTELRKTDQETFKSTETESKPQIQSGPIVSSVDTPKLLAATVSGDSVSLEPILEQPLGQTPMMFSANRTFSNLNMPGVKVLGVEVKERVAYVDCNDVLTSGVGSDQEATLVKALEMTFGQFKDIDGFVLRVNGEEVDTLGHFELTSPNPVIRIGKSQPEALPTTPAEDPASAVSH